MAGGFIALSIMLGIGTLILGGSVTDCSQLEGYNDSNSTATAKQLADPAYHSGWATQCLQNNAQSQSVDTDF